MPVSTEVPNFYPIALDGRGYLVDLGNQQTQFSRKSIPLLRRQADFSSSPGSSSLNPEDLWRRPMESWHHGTGQTYFDRESSDQVQFKDSFGVDPWTKWNLTLLPVIAQKKSSATITMSTLSTFGRLYVFLDTGASNTSLCYSATPGTTNDFTFVTGTPAAGTAGSGTTAMTSDGQNIWAAYNASGIYQTTAAIGTAAQRISDPVHGVAYVAGRLMAYAFNSLYNITANAVATTGAAAALPTALYTHPNGSFSWNSITEGPNYIYASGFAGDQSLIYKTTIKADGTALDVPTVAATLPVGERITCIRGYLGFVLIGGVGWFRLANIDSNGNLICGPRIDLYESIYCFECRGQYAWAGTALKAGQAGLIRFDLANFTAPLVPAYANDLSLAVNSAAVYDMTFFQGVKVVVINSNGVYVETTDKMASGYVELSCINYGLHDNKIPMYLDVKTEPLAGSYQSSFTTDGGSPVVSAAQSTALSVASSVAAPRTAGSEFHWKLTLTRSSGDTTLGPTIRLMTLRSYPAVRSGETAILPILLHETLSVGDAVRTINPQVELDYIRNLANTQALIDYQEGNTVYTAYVDDFDWQPWSQTKDGSFWNGLCVVSIKIPSTT